MNHLYILRGLPGSGKSHLARSLSPHIATADDWFRDFWTDKYTYDAAQLPQAHAYCLGRAEAFMSMSAPVVVVDNTHIRLAHISPYLDMADRFGYVTEILTPNTPWANDPSICFSRCQHNVPLEVIQRMQAEFEVTDHLSIMGRIAAQS